MTAANNGMGHHSAGLQDLIFLPGFPTLHLYDPEYPVPHRAGSAFLGKDEVEDLVHTAVADTHQGIQFSEFDPLLDLFAHSLSVRKKTEIHKTPP
jgi:hypothetical protein